MRRLSMMTSFARAWLGRRRMEREMDAEMRFHLEARAADLEATGLSREDAERRARAEFGGVIRWKEAGRDARGLRLVDELTADLRYAARALRRSPAFTAAALLSLTLGIGANTAIFGLMDVLLFRSVPVRNPHELVHVTTAGERGDANSGSSNDPWFQLVAAHTDLFADTMLERHDVYKVGIGSRVEPLTGQQVTTNYYNLLGVPAFAGRTFVPADRPEQGGSPVAVISYDLWQRRFAGASTAIGTTITVDQRPYTIVGVTPPEFRGLFVGWTMDVTVPLDRSRFGDARGWSTMPLIARVRPGVTREQIVAQLTPQLIDLARGVTERFRRRYLERVAVDSAAQGITDLRAAFSRPLSVLMMAVGLLLLIACVNLAGLLIARNTARQPELAVRLALGAGRPRIVRQLLTESAVLAVLGSIPGVGLGIIGGNLLLGFLPPQLGPLSIAVTADWRILTFALTATAATTLLFGLMPAFHAARIDATPELIRAHRRSATARMRAGRVLVAVQFALSVVMVAGAALFLRTLLNLSRVETGFEREHVLVVRMDPQGTAYEGERLRGLQRDLLAALASLRGVRYVTLSTSSPFNGNLDGRRLNVPGIEPRDPDDSVIQVNLVVDHYFDVLGVPLVTGRAIDGRDDANTAPVVVVSEHFARRYFGGAAPALGKYVTIGRGPTAITPEIVGVARDVRYQDLRTASERLVYLPWFQAREIRSTPFEFVLRTDEDPSTAIAVTRRAIEQLRPDAPVLAIQTMTTVINGRLVSERLLAFLATFFAAVALILAAVGVYGLLAYLVARRIPEIGVRIALGARPIEIIRMTLREHAALAVAAAAAGVLLAIAGLRTLDGIVFGLAPTDTVNLVLSVGILLLVSVAAALIPARRAATIDPLVALRSE